MNFQRSWLLYILILGLINCGKKTKEKNLNVEETWKKIPPKAKSVTFSEGVWINIEGLDKQEQFLEITFKTDNIQVKNEAPKTISGFHWSWTQETRGVSFWSDADQEWKPFEGWTLPQGPILELRVPVSWKENTRDSRWPAVVGRSRSEPLPLDTSEAKTSTITLPGFLNVTWSNTSLPIFVNIEGYDILGSGDNCVPESTSCKRFGNYAEGSDAVLTVVPKNNKIRSVRRDNVSLIFGAGSEGVQQLDVLETNPLVLDSLQGMRDFFNKNAFETVSTSSYSFHLTLNNRCIFQGLEHFTSTLISVDPSCRSTSLVEDFLTLAAHEFLHVWMGRWIESSETQSVNLNSFIPERLSLAYMYEGFTEGITRMYALTFLSPLVSLASGAKKWNQSIKNLESGISKNLQQLSLESPSLTYDFGSLFVLELSVAASEILHLSKIEIMVKHANFLRELLKLQSKDLDIAKKPWWQLAKFSSYAFFFDLQKFGGEPVEKKHIAEAISTVYSEPVLLSMKHRWLEDSPVFSDVTDLKSWRDSLSERIKVLWGADGFPAL